MRRGATVAELLVAAGLLVLALSLLIGSTVRCARGVAGRVTRLGAAQGSVALRTYLERDLARVALPADVDVKAGPPLELSLVLRRERTTVRYWCEGGDLFRDEAGRSSRICRNFHGTVAIQLSPGGGLTVSMGEARSLDQTFQISAVQTAFDKYYRNGLPRGR